MTKLIVCNWKMNLGGADATDFLPALNFKSHYNTARLVICPPYTTLALVHDFIKHQNLRCQLGAQDCSAAAKGAYTGDISAGMLKQLGCGYVILGHSERRLHHAESNRLVKEKATQALAQGLTPIICIGESEADYKAGKTIAILENQLKGSVPNGNVIIAYEPIWAIGTGKTPTLEEIDAVHKNIASILEKMGHNDTPILYGGSVNPDNLNQVLPLPHVGGVLIGGASIKPESMNAILQEVAL